MPGVTRRVMMTTDAVGGVWRYSMDLAHGLTRRGWSVRLAVLGPPPGPAQRAEALAELVETGLQLDWTAESPAELERISASLAQVAQGSDVALLHAPALLGDAAWPAPVATTVHSCVGTWWRAVRGGPLPPDLAWRAAATRAGLLRTGAVIAPTCALAAALQDIYGVTEPTVVHNGRVPRLAPEVVGRRGVLTAGRLWDEGKGVACLDRVASRLGAPFAAAGSIRAPDGAGIVLRHLRLLGVLDEPAMAAAMAAARVFASAARYEPFGLAVLEAAQAGCALVLSDIPSFRELWDDAAVFVASGDEDGWVSALTAAHADPALGGAARARAARYTADAMVDATAAILARL